MNVHLQNNTSFSCAQRADDGEGKNDHLGNTRAVYRIPECGSGGPKYEYEALIDYYPFGKELRSSVLLHERYYTTHHERDDRTQLDYRGARFYDAEVGRFWGVDGMASARNWASPYNYVQNNPPLRVDPSGTLDHPIYDQHGEFMGTDDLGIQGEAIIMNRNDFKQGMSHESALSVGTTRSKLPLIYKSEFYDKIDSHHSNLPSRPDWDGHLTLKEANDWYRNGDGQPLFTDLSKIDLSGIYSKGEKYVNQVKYFNLLLNNGNSLFDLLLNSSSIQDGLVYGSITLKRYPNHQVRAYSDLYDFEMHNPWNPLNFGRNIETLIGRNVAGVGKPFEINIYGSATLKPLFPWTK